MEDPTFDRHGLTPVTVLNQAMSGLAHLHSLNIGKGTFSLRIVLIKMNFKTEGNYHSNEITTIPSAPPGLLSYITCKKIGAILLSDQKRVRKLNRPKY